MQLNTPFSDSVPQDPSQGRLAGERTCRCEYPHTTYRMILLVFNCNVIHIILQFTLLNRSLIGIRTTVIYSLYFLKILTAMTIFHCRTLSWVFFFFSIFCWWVFWLFLIFHDERAIVNLLVHISLCVGEGESPGLGCLGCRGVFCISGRHSCILPRCPPMGFYHFISTPPSTTCHFPVSEDGPGSIFSGTFDAVRLWYICQPGGC